MRKGPFYKDYFKNRENKNLIYKKKEIQSENIKLSNL